MATRNQIEIEAKIAIDDFDAMEARLLSAGGKKKGKYTETDAFFDFEDRRLKQADSALRLRERRDLEGPDVWHRLTFKGPKHGGVYKQRREVEFGVDQPENVKMLLESLGMKVFFQYTKRRNSWVFNDCDIEVDQIEGVGDFIEVEGPDETCIRRVIETLGLQDRPVIHESYLSMVIRQRGGL